MSAAILGVASLLLRVNVPDNVVWKTVDSVASTFGHLGESFCLSLVLEGVAGEVDACPAN